MVSIARCSYATFMRNWIVTLRAYPWSFFISGLDAPIARELRTTIRKLGEEGKGVLLTSHYLKEVEELCAFVYVIDQGSIVAQGSPEALKTLTRQDRIVRILLPELPADVETALQGIAAETGARLEEEHNDDGVVLTVRHPADLSGRVAATVALHGGSMLKLEVLEPTLEDAMLVLASSTREKEQMNVTA